MRRCASLFALTLLLGTAAPEVRALVLDAGEGSRDTLPPAYASLWDHVGKRWGGPTVVYLGRGWVLTARHVGAGIIEIGGERYDPLPESVTPIRNPDGSSADLILFRIGGNPELPDLSPLEIARVSPRPAEDALLIGFGRARGYRVTIGDHRFGLLDGWTWDRSSRKRWGTNQISTWPLEIEGHRTRTRAIVTRFDRLEDPESTPHEAQAATGDSGGALFAHSDPFDAESPWWLAGILFSVTNRAAGPERSAFYGDLSYSVDLSAYRHAIFEAMNAAPPLPPPRLRQPGLPFFATSAAAVLFLAALCVRRRMRSRRRRSTEVQP